MVFLPCRKSSNQHRYSPMSMQMDEDSAISQPTPWSRGSEHEPRRSRIRRLFSCRSRKGESQDNGLPPEENSPPLYYILSEVPSEEMNTPHAATIASKKDDKASKSRLCSRISGLKNCFKEASQRRDEDTASMGKEHNTSFEDGDSAMLQRDGARSFEISSNSAFSPVNKFAYPVQARVVGLPSQELLRISPINRLDSLGYDSNEEDVSSFTDSSFTESSYFKGAQLILQAFSNDSDSSSGSLLLGAAIAHPTFVVGTCEDHESRLGIQTGHPFWNKREKTGRVWRFIDSYKGSETLPLPPSPIVVETVANDGDDSYYWDDDDEDWEHTDQQCSKCDGHPHPVVRVSVTNGIHDENASFHSLRDQVESKPPREAVHPVFKRETRQAPSDGRNFIPDRLTKNVIEPMCAFAKEISSCGRLDDAGFFEDAPFDEIALDREQQTVGYRVQTFVQQHFEPIDTQPRKDLSRCRPLKVHFPGRHNGVHHVGQQWRIPAQG